MMKFPTTFLASRNNPIPFIETLTTGAGIFLGCMVIAFVLLYGQTKERWNWAAPHQLLSKGCRGVMRIVGLTLVGLLNSFAAMGRRIGSIRRKSWRLIGCVIAGVAVLGVAGFAVWTHQQTIARKGRYIDFDELRLGMSEDDVKVLKGAPSKIDDLTSGTSGVGQQKIQRWLYNGNVEFWGEVILCRLYFRDARLIALDRPLLPPFKAFKDYREKYGVALLQKTNRSGLSRWYFVKDKGLYYNVVGGEIVCEGNYNPKDQESFAGQIIQNEEETDQRAREIHEAEATAAVEETKRQADAAKERANADAKAAAEEAERKTDAAKEPAQAAKERAEMELKTKGLKLVSVCGLRLGMSEADVKIRLGATSEKKGSGIIEGGLVTDKRFVAWFYPKQKLVVLLRDGLAGEIDRKVIAIEGEVIEMEESKGLLLQNIGSTLESKRIEEAESKLGRMLRPPSGFYTEKVKTVDEFTRLVGDSAKSYDSHDQITRFIYHPVNGVYGIAELGFVYRVGIYDTATFSLK